MSRWLYHQMLVSSQLGGGASVAVGIHQRAVENRGDVSRLIVPVGGAAEQLAREAGFPKVNYRIDRLLDKRPIVSLAENARILGGLLPARRGIIHVHAPHVFGALRPMLKAIGFKTVLHVHLDFPAEQLRWAMKSSPDLVVLCAEYMRPVVEQAMSAAGHDKARIKVLRNAIDVATFEPEFDRVGARERLRIGSNPKWPTLLVAANLSPHKGQETAIRAVAHLKCSGCDVGLWLAGLDRSGDEGYLESLKSLCLELEVRDRVEFLGFRKDVPKLLQAVDFLLLPSTSEGLPLVILEAQATGTLVLAAPTAGIPEVVKDGISGRLIGAKDPESYAHGIREMLDAPQKYAAMVDQARQHVRKNHDFRAYSTRMLAEYDELMQS